MDEQKGPEDPQDFETFMADAGFTAPSQLDVAAAQHFLIFSAYVNAGFSDDHALKLLQTMIFCMYGRGDI